jgi:hypothetical protein
VATSFKVTLQGEPATQSGAAVSTKKLSAHTLCPQLGAGAAEIAMTSGAGFGRASPPREQAAASSMAAAIGIVERRAIIDLTG